jgi:hypothetical protein
MTMKLRSRNVARALATTSLTLFAGGSTVMGCLNRPIEPVDPRTTSTIVERITQTAVDKIDVLLAIDNSASMADKQQILADAIPDLVSRLVNPDCVSMDGMTRQTPADPKAECPMGLEREFDPILDINIGIVSSSLGLATVCAPGSPTNPNNNDQGQLLHRSAPTMNNDIPTYNNAGFLAWDPDGKRTPTGLDNSATLQMTFQNMVIGTGQVGCGYEQQLESIYRFLADPAPKVWEFAGSWQKSENDDMALLEQRKQFLRSNSLLAVIILSDENDCSVSDPVILNTTPFFKAADQCAADPNDKCCTSCFFAIRDGAPEGCDLASMKCDENGDGKADANPDDKAELKCVKQKQNYGYNFLYPTARYVNAFTQFQLDPKRGDLSAANSKNAVANPIYTDLSGQGLPTRSQDLVFVAGIVGVPWDVVAQKNDQGVTTSFKTFDVLTADGFWEKYVGDPDNAIYPTEAVMQESIDARGVPTDRTINPRVDIQYACFFDLTTPKAGGADCGDNEANDPLCNPAMNSEQIAAKGYPGTRELAFLRGLGGQGIVASVCAENTTDTTAVNYGYRPAVNAIIDRLKTALGGQCLPRKLAPVVDSKGNSSIPCLVLEASSRADGPKSGKDVDAATKIISSSACPEELGREKVPEERVGAIVAALNDPLTPVKDGVPIWNNFCAVKQLLNDERRACQTQQDVASSINGWCYVSNDVGEATGCAQYSGAEYDGCAAQVEGCPASEKHIIRFVNNGEAQAGATQLITCSGDSAN